MEKDQEITESTDRYLWSIEFFRDYARSLMWGSWVCDMRLRGMSDDDIQLETTKNHGDDKIKPAP
jgi:hypothetical protein